MKFYFAPLFSMQPYLIVTLTCIFLMSNERIFLLLFAVCIHPVVDCVLYIF